MIYQGQILKGTYEVMEPIGEGSAGLVFLGWHINLRKKIVIKKIKDKYVDHINVRTEVDILKNLHHSNLPQVYDFVEDGPDVYTVIDYIEGITMMELIRRSGGRPIAERMVLKWLLEMLDALSYVHSQNPPIIHSDIKPSNMMIDNSDRCWLIDFNISRSEGSRREFAGYSAGYVSPEQMRRIEMYSRGGNYQDVRMDARSDLFSLASSFYTLMTGRNAVRCLQRDEPLWDGNERYSQGLKDILEQAMEPDPDDRYQSADAMAGAIRNLHRKDDSLQQLRVKQMIFTIVCVGVMAAGCIMAMQGLRARRTEQFRAAVSEVRELGVTDRYQETIDKAVNTLNAPEYRSMFRHYPEEEADLLYILGNCYFLQEDYTDAVTYYNEAMHLDQTNPDLFRDCAIASARKGDVAMAQQIINAADQYQLKDDDLYLIQAEIALTENRFEDAAEAFRQAIQLTSNEELKCRAYILMGKAYERFGDPDSQIQALQSGLTNTDSAWRTQILSELGSACVRAIEKQNPAAEDYAGRVQTYVDIAIPCYTELTNGAGADFYDWVNLALLYEHTGRYEDGQNTLLRAEEKYPDRYELYMYLSLLEINKQAGVDESVRSYTEAETYYKKADELYRKQAVTGTGDATMQKLAGQIQEIHDKGWL